MIATRHRVFVQNGYTALHRAAYYNKLGFGKMLVEEGHADLSLKTQVKRDRSEADC